MEGAAERLVEHAAKIMLDDVERIAQVMNDQELRALPGLNHDATIYAETLASNRANLERLLTVASRSEKNVLMYDSPPEAFDVGRTFARRGISIDLLFLAYWHGQHAALGEFIATLQKLPNVDPEVGYQAITRYVQISTQYGDQVIREVLDAEREERKATSLGAHAVRNDRVRLILDGAPVDVERSSELMNYELTRYHTGLVMWHEGPTAQQGLFEDLVLAAGRSVGDRNPIIMPAGAYAVWAWIGTRDEVVIDRLKNALQGVTQGRIVVGPTRYGIQGFRTTHTACLEMQRVFSGRSMGPGIAWYRDFAVSTLVGQDSQRAKDFVHDTLGALAQTSKRAARLRQTLRIYLAEGSNAPRTAELLHMHRNTVRQRIDSAAELLGYDPEQHRLAVELALELHHKLGL